MRYDTDLDSPAASFCTATGRVLLAHWETSAVDAYFARSRLIAYTPFTVTDPARLHAILAQVRRDGVALHDQEYVAGSSGIAAPVRDREGTVVAALNLGALTARFHLRRDEIIAAMKGAAAQVSQRFGYAPNAAAP